MRSCTLHCSERSSAIFSWQLLLLLFAARQRQYWCRSDSMRVGKKSKLSTTCAGMLSGSFLFDGSFKGALKKIYFFIFKIFFVLAEAVWFFIKRLKKENIARVAAWCII